MRGKREAEPQLPTAELFYNSGEKQVEKVHLARI